MATPDPIPDLLTAVNDASARGFALWVTFLTVITYLAVAIGTTTHAQLLLEGPLKLPLLGVDLPLFAFYQVTPALFLILHFYVLMQLYLLSRTLRLFDGELQFAQLIQKDRERIRAQLDKFVLTQMLAAAPSGWALRLSLRVAVWLTLLVAPVMLLLAFEIRFLPYHDVPTIWMQRAVLLLDILVIWVMWPAITFGASSRGMRPRVAKAVLALLCGILAAFALFVASVPSEGVERTELALGWPIHNENGRQIWWPTWCLFEGEPDPVGSKTTSLFSRNLVLANKQLVDSDKDRLAKADHTLSLRGRDLRFAVLEQADLRKADLFEARLQGASLHGAQLRGASLDYAQLEDASLIGAQLQGASLNEAQLQGASLVGAQLQGASLNGAHLQGASLDGAQLQGAWIFAELEGASLNGAQLQGASLNQANLEGSSLIGAGLQGASLNEADLEGASLDSAQLQGASLNRAHLQGASLRSIFAWRADLSEAELQNARVSEVFLEPKQPCSEDPKVCNWTATSLHQVRDEIERSMPVGKQRDSCCAVAKCATAPLAGSVGSRAR